MKTDLLTGIDTLCRDHADWLRGRKVGLVAHPASVNAGGMPSPEFLRQNGVDLAALFGPEHGFAGGGGAGQELPHGRHPQWDIPIHSLYGETRKPTPDMLSGLDVIVFDLQDLGARPYTYVSTLRYVLEAATENRKAVIVADRPAPLPNVVDGPMLDPAFESFVGFIPSPVVYGMTSGETARWLKSALGLDLELNVAAMQGYTRPSAPAASQPWIPPSPAIRSRECAMCFPITVFFEALPALDHGRGTETPFQLIGAPWLDHIGLCHALDTLGLPGVRFLSEDYEAAIGSYRGQTVHGIEIHVTEPDRLRPVQTGAAIIHALQDLHGQDFIWGHPGTREDFFDQLMGTDAVRTALRAGEPAAGIAAGWALESVRFREARESCLLYH
ncbi:MAG: hypothetical protein BWK77_07225 [Verrucomicrobia bacterium A1]|nr:MAG: hypothetical protein BWK77_07225 [Verrucomicrobia bacterium A1]